MLCLPRVLAEVVRLALCPLCDDSGCSCLSECVCELEIRSVVFFEGSPLSDSLLVHRSTRVFSQRLCQTSSVSLRGTSRSCLQSWLSCRHSARVYQPEAQNTTGHPHRVVSLHFPMWHQRPMNSVITRNCTVTVLTTRSALSKDAWLSECHVFSITTTIHCPDVTPTTVFSHVLHLWPSSKRSFSPRSLEALIVCEVRESTLFAQ